MQIMPRLARERVAVGVAMTTPGVLLGLVAQDAVQAFIAGSLVGWGVTMTAAALLRLRREAQLEKLRKTLGQG